MKAPRSSSPPRPGRMREPGAPLRMRRHPAGDRLRGRLAFDCGSRRADEDGGRLLVLHRSRRRSAGLRRHVVESRGGVTASAAGSTVTVTVVATGNATVTVIARDREELAATQDFMVAALERLTNGTASDYSPAWSPDGTKILSRPTATATPIST